MLDAKVSQKSNKEINQLNKYNSQSSSQYKHQASNVSCQSMKGELSGLNNHMLRFLDLLDFL